ncbi:MAG TPA: hypothetical protein PLO99_00925 [Chitinophagaceae bacterium]|jgi:hypothetical protein|nr:hypothetical protein [Chitinophagaceae bacterium]HRG92564.1 hypothetical protein [Chitinophagaceae bacterium]
MDQQQESSLFDIHMDNQAQSSLLAISKWAKFVAVTGIIIGAIVLVLAISYGPQIIQAFSALLSLGTNQEEAGVLIATLVIAVLLVSFWLYFLLRTSNLLNQGLESRSSALLAAGFRSMRVYFVISFVMSLLSIISALTELF